MVVRESGAGLRPLSRSASRGRGFRAEGAAPRALEEGGPGGFLGNLWEREQGYCYFEPFLCERFFWDLTGGRCICAHFTDGKPRC